MEQPPGAITIRLEVAQLTGTAAKVVVQTALVLTTVELTATVRGQAAVRVEASVDEAERTVVVHDCSNACKLVRGTKDVFLKLGHSHVFDTSPCLVFCLMQTL